MRALAVRLALWALLQCLSGVPAVKYRLDSGKLKPYTIFRVNVQRTVGSTEPPYKQALAQTLSNAHSTGSNPNTALADYFKEVLDDTLGVRVLNSIHVQLHFAVLVSEYSFAASNGDTEDVWLEGGPQGEQFSGGLTQWPGPRQHDCLDMEHQDDVLPRDDPLGRPCKEGGAVAMKGEDWDRAVNKPKNVMIFYLPTEQLRKNPRSTPAFQWQKVYDV